MPWNAIFEPKERPDPETLKKAYRAVFSGPAGRVVLADICTSIKLVQNPKNGDAADSRAFHDGQRSVALKIINHLKEGV